VPPQASAVVCAAAPKPVQAAKLALAGLSAAILLSAAPPAFATNLCSSQPTCAFPARAPHSFCTLRAHGRGQRRRRGAGCALRSVPMAETVSTTEPDMTRALRGPRAPAACVAGKVNSSIVKPTAASKGDASNDLNGATSHVA
jgi:hypothetical protein